MATMTVLIDDLSPVEERVPAAETVAFGLDGAAFEIDLSADNASAIREALAPFLAVARRSDAPLKGLRDKPKRKYTRRSADPDLTVEREVVSEPMFAEPLAPAEQSMRAAEAAVGMVSAPVKLQQLKNDRKAYLAQVREWAATQGLTVAPRGRIAESITEAFDEQYEG